MPANVHFLVCKCANSTHWRVGRDGETHFLLCDSCGYEIPVKIALPDHSEIHWRNHER